MADVEIDPINESHEYFTRIVAPTIGSILSLILFSSSYKTYRNIERTGSVGSVRVLPQLMLHTNCMYWTLYAYVNSNYAMIPINFIGVIYTLFYIMLYYSAAEKKIRTMIELFMIIGYLVFFGVVTLTMYVFLPRDFNTELILSVIANVPNILFYAAPLVTIAEIVREKSTASLSFPLTVTSFCCAAFWGVFGIGERKVPVVIPNALGILFSGIQIAMFLIYKKPSTAGDAAAAAAGGEKNSSPYAQQVDEREDIEAASPAKTVDVSADGMTNVDMA